MNNAEENKNTQLEVKPLTFNNQIIIISSFSGNVDLNQESQWACEGCQDQYGGANETKSSVNHWKYCKEGRNLQVSFNFTSLNLTFELLNMITTSRELKAKQEAERKLKVEEMEKRRELVRQNKEKLVSEQSLAPEQA